MFQEKFQRYVRHTTPVLRWWIAARQDGLPVPTCTKAHQSRRRPRGRRRTPAWGGGAARTTMTTVSMHLLLMLLLCVSRDSTAGTVSAYSLSPGKDIKCKTCFQPANDGIPQSILLLRSICCLHEN
uniref:Uncharacterized protein n=1 Tax=Anopheles melas TaxID=34690 RepID=A0A182TSS2_9DIPT